MGNKSVHIVLMGDSTIDNRLYVGKGNPSVIEQLQSRAEERSWKASSVAVDGQSIEHISQQMKSIPDDATHLFISIGGNNALDLMQVLEKPVKNVLESLLILNDSQKQFEREYAAMLDEVSQLQIPTTVCTIYNPNFGFPEQQRACETGLTAINDVILRQAIQRRIPVIDLRTVFNDVKDYANHIEPDVQGGSKIVENIVYIVDNHRFDQSKDCCIYAHR